MHHTKNRLDENQKTISIKKWNIGFENAKINRLHLLSTNYLINSRKHEWRCCQPKQKISIKLHRKVFQMIKESNVERMCESIILETQVIFST